MDKKEWIIKNFSKFKTNREMLTEFEKQFGKTSYQTLVDLCIKLKLYRAVNKQQYGEEQKQWLKDNYPLYKDYFNSLELITKAYNEKFNRNETKEHIRSRLRKFKLTQDKTFTPEQLKWLSENPLDVDKFNKVFGENRTRQALLVITRKNNMRDRLKSPKTRDLTQDEIKFIQENYDKYSVQQLYELISPDMHPHVFNQKLVDLGFRKFKKTQKKLNHEQIQILKNYQNYIRDNVIDYDTLSKKTNLNRNRIRRELINLGFDLSSYSRSGSEPIGYEFIKEGRVYIKISNDYRAHHKNYVLKNRYLYEKYHNVKLSDDDLIIHLDGDLTNFSSENLVLLTRGEFGIFNTHEKTPRTRKTVYLYSKLRGIVDYD